MIEKDEIVQLIKRFDETARGSYTILYISYNSKEFDRLDKYLRMNIFAPIIVVFDAPEWLVNLKQKAWNKHRIIDHQKEPHLSPFLFSKVVVYSGKVDATILETAEFFEQKLINNQKLMIYAESENGIVDNQ